MNELVMRSFFIDIQDNFKSIVNVGLAVIFGFYRRYEFIRDGIISPG